MMAELDRIIGLHELIEIHYVVDGYTARVTIEEALTKLNTWAKDYKIVDRKLVRR